MRLRQFGAYVRKVFHLHRLAGRITDSRCDPDIPTSAIWFGLLFGAVFKTPSFLQLQSETRRKAWQTTVGYAHPISDDALAYATERMHLEPLRTTLATTSKLLKLNKAFRRNQMSGLLALNLDANEHFKSRSRCCPQCLQRQITVNNAQGTCGTAPIMIRLRAWPVCSLRGWPSTCFMPLFCSMVSSIGRARSPSKNCACNSIGPLNTACSFPCSAGEPKDRL
jgi:hypothetical protein